ncbi:phosphatidylinositol-specific phospholipase C/glycerophosphodiester phosphodiesterase family protein [Segetibacter koreensis]|uniref:phosphatidylinositol-specific phospholipase C/glycerophosphodiester phosphodiesterase family protein n=1 Tax=Segetibacter koreensis TaxID=398037 RepID=UPI00037A8934|nr:phosphatidylinositol-specific phospholipase C/glycerophosphodiester phosphodiesterase family protein [Segetibacter koreensis]
MKYIYYCLFLCIFQSVSAQPAQYTVANAHSHNDYEQADPFWAAYNAGFGSIEADIFLREGQLLVAHEEKELVYKRSLEDLYLKPLQSCIEKQKGFVYNDTTKQLQLLIDIKTDSIATLNKLITVLQQYPTLINNPSLKIVITGGRPVPDKFPTYPPYILFDGNVGTRYSQASLDKIAMLSSSFKNYSQWNGTGSITKKEKALLKAEIDNAHALHKPVRFWEAPDTTNAWYQLMRLQIDFINTDHINQLAAFLNKYSKTR